MHHEAIIETLLDKIISDPTVTTKNQLYRLTNEVAALSQSPTTPPIFQILAGYRARLERT